MAALGFAATVLSPLLAERSRRKSVHLEQLRERRLALYSDLLRITARIAENAETCSAIPSAEPEETDQAEIERVVSQAAVLASSEVDELLREFSREANVFFRDLVLVVKPHHERLRRGEGPPSGEATAIEQRMALGEKASRLREGHKALRARIRIEMDPEGR
ncbi:hypothetical protein ACWFMI_27160 [Nocardiopsis terrae]